jgi:hypothetical protein
MKSDFDLGRKLGEVRGWLMGAAIVIVGIVYLLRR